MFPMTKKLETLCQRAYKEWIQSRFGTQPVDYRAARNTVWAILDESLDDLLTKILGLDTHWSGDHYRFDRGSWVGEALQKIADRAAREWLKENEAKILELAKAKLPKAKALSKIVVDHYHEALHEQLRGYAEEKARQDLRAYLEKIGGQDLIEDEEPKETV